MTKPAECTCDPPGSGEEHCTGHCFLRAELRQAQREVARLRTDIQQIRDAREDRRYLDELLRPMEAQIREIVRDMPPEMQRDYVNAFFDCAIHNTRIWGRLLTKYEHLLEIPAR